MLRCCSAVLLAISLAVAGEPAPFLDVALADVQATLTHWEATPFAAAWNAPGAAPLRAKAREAIAEATGCGEADQTAILAALKSARFRLLAPESAPGQPRPLLWIDAGSQAATLFTLIAAKHPAATLPGVDEAITFNEMILARTGNVLLLTAATPGVAPAMPPVPGNVSDLVLHFDGPRLLAALPGMMEKPLPQGLSPALATVLGTIKGRWDLGGSGIASKVTIAPAPPGTAVIDRALLRLLPENALDASAMGVDGEDLWNRVGTGVVTAIDAENGVGSCDAVLAKFLPGTEPAPTWEELISSFKGTVVFATSPGTPMPGYTIIIPRSPALDRVIERAVVMTGNAAPLEGETTYLTFANVPIMPALIREPKHWIVSTDGTFGTGLPPITGEGWLATPLGLVAAQHLTPSTRMISVTDVEAVMRMASTFVGMALGAAKMSAPERQAVMGMFTHLIKHGGRSWTDATVGADGVMTLQGDGLMSGNAQVAVVAVIAAIAIPNLLESRVAANEAAAASTLKSAILPGQVVFQSGTYIDADGDGLGEYTDDLDLMAGGKATSGGIILTFLSPKFRGEDPVVNGYRYAIDLGEDPEQTYVAYAWPAKQDQGRRWFALDQRGNVYFRLPPNVGGQPDPLSLYGGKTFEESKGVVAEPWRPYRR